MVLMGATFRTQDTAHVNLTLEAQIFNIYKSTSPAFRMEIVQTTICIIVTCKSNFLRRTFEVVRIFALVESASFKSVLSLQARCLPLPPHPAMVFILVHSSPMLLCWSLTFSFLLQWVLHSSWPVLYLSTPHFSTQQNFLLIGYPQLVVWIKSMKSLSCA